MATCSVGDCEITCPKGCVCWQKPGKPCQCRCVHSKFEPFADQVSSSTIVNFCAKDMDLADLASYLNYLFPDQIAIPASKVYKQVSIQLKEVTISEVIKELGLIALKEPLEGKEFNLRQ